MKTFAVKSLLALIIVGTTVGCGGRAATPVASTPYPDAARYEKAIQRFEAADRESAPPTGAIVSIGSSSMRGWNKAIGADLAPLTIIPRGFGGSTMYDALHFADRIVLPYSPRAVLLYEGDNDVAMGIAPAKIAETFRQFVAKVHEQYPECRIYTLSIKPSINRWAVWPTMVEANSLIAAECEKDDRLTYIDVATPMLDDAGQPIKELLAKDKLHMSRAGYDVWRDVIRPILMKKELTYEKQAK